jgi:hypothetical protein
MGLFIEDLDRLGFTLLDFGNRRALRQLRSIVRGHLGPQPRRWHRAVRDGADYLEQVKRVADAVVAGDAVTRLIDTNIEPFLTLFGPDLDIQGAPHVRVARPDCAGDQVGWHRDVFYGNSPWELNVWFPLFALPRGAGLRYLPRSHRTPPSNVRWANDENVSSGAVTKGSIAHQLGFVYQPKTDDTIAGIDEDDTVLLRPRVGQAVVFFGSGVHRGQNRSPHTRITIDVRLKHAFAPSDARSGYYKPLRRGVVSITAERLLTHSLEWLFDGESEEVCHITPGAAQRALK